MTEKQYIEAKALGTITAAINALRDIVPDNLTHIIKEGESHKAIGTLIDWQDRLFESIQLNQDITSVSDCNCILAAEHLPNIRKVKLK